MSYRTWVQIRQAWRAKTRRGAARGIHADMVPLATGENTLKMLRSVVLHTHIPPPRYPGSRSTCCDIIQAVPRQCNPQLTIITVQSSKAWEAHVYTQPERLSHSSHMLPAASSGTGFNRPPPSCSAFSLCNRLKKSDPTWEGWVVHEWMHHRLGA